MDSTTLIAIVVVAVAVLGVIGLVTWMNSRKQSQRLHDRFGPEYESTLESADSRRKAERELAEREKRVEKLHLKELTPGEQQVFVEEWRVVQGRFVDEPSQCVLDADKLVQRVMDARGYPTTGFDQQAADVSVDHPEVVRNYRAAHGIALRDEQNDATTEDLRQAMVHYRALFAELLGAVPVS